MLIATDTATGPALAAELKRDARIILEGTFQSLTAAYSPAESRPPDLVICTRDVTEQPEFAMFDALLDTVGCTVIKLPVGGGAALVLRALGLPPPAPVAAAVGSGGARTGLAPMGLLRTGPQRLVAIGSSTGGIEALSLILKAYPEDCPPTVIVQHIKPEFLDSVVARLDAVCPATVLAATDDLKLTPGRVVFAPGRPVHLEIQPTSLRCRLGDGPLVSGHRPSVDRLFQSVAALKSRAVGVLLTGMGRDGATGLGDMRRAGAWTIAQDAATSTVYGMPRVAHEEGAVCEVLPLPRICRAILNAARISSEVAS